MSRIASIVVAALVLAVAGPAVAQSPKPASDPRQSRYQIGVMERVLEGAVEHGASITRDRLRAVVPADMLLSENARARGFRLEGYGVFFDVGVPSLEGPLLWSFRTLDRNDLGLDSALKALRSHVERQGDQNLQQALKRIELQMGPLTVPARAGEPAVTGARTVTGSAAVAAAPPSVRPNDAILTDPEEAYRAEVKQALIDAMLDHSSSLNIAAEDWLTVAARGNGDRPRLGGGDATGVTLVIRVRGADLAAFLARQISRDEAIRRVDVRVF